MRIARWQDASGHLGDGFVIEDRVVPFPDGMGVDRVIRDGLASARELFAAVNPARGTRLDEVTLLAPLQPATVRDFVAFEEHVEGVSASIDGQSHVPAEWYDAPTFYFTNPHTILGPDEAVVPPETARLDFELEVAAIVGGAGGANLTVGQAADVVFGYTVMNDWSARDLQSREMKVRLGPAKGKDFATSLGPWIVTADELADYLDPDGLLAVQAHAFVNGVLVGEDLVSNMGWTFPELVAYASRNSRVVAGDVLGSGTVGNGGCLAELWGRRQAETPPPLVAGDEVRLVVEGIGELVARVGSAVTAPPISRARPRSRARHRAEADA